MRRWILRMAAVTVLLPRPAPALTFLELASGDEALAPDARSLAMGRIRVLGTGAFSVGDNPAYLARTEHTLLGFGGASQRLQESRSIPAYDSFDGFLVESVYVLNTDYHNTGGIGIAHRATPEWLGGAAGVGASYQPMRDYRYAYSEEVRDNNAFQQPRDGLIALNEITSSGQLLGVTIGLALAPVEWISGGASIQFASGNQDLLYRTQFFDPDSTVQTTVGLSSLSGERVLLGLTVEPSHRFEISGSWKFKYKVDGDYGIQGDPSHLDFVGTPTGGTSGGVVVTYPHEGSIGVAFRPRAKLRTTIQAEAGYTKWSQFRNTLFTTGELEDVWEGRVGLEHVFYNGFAARFGFRYTPSPQSTEIVTSSFTFGGGARYGPVLADVGFEIGTREYRFDDLFPDSEFGGDDRTSKDKVEEKTFGAYLTLGIELDNFGS